ncbi:MAG: hypothetical protein J0L88_01070 [Xanthomonadales bacterium]|nr:hypothetical protein [Xanthomonadales bacterium]
MRTVLMLVLACATTPVLAAGSAQTMTQRAAGARPASTAGIPAALYDQTSNNSGWGFWAQDQEPANAAFSSEIADDFIVPAGGWRITSITTIANAYNATQKLVVSPGPMNVRILGNTGGNLPDEANVACGPYSALPINWNPTTEVATITLPAACELAPGHYWLALSNRLDYGIEGVTYNPWLRDGVTNQPAVWRQPGNGFGSGCTNWAPLQSCNGPWQPANPDLLFSLIGETMPVALQRFEVE